MTNTLGFNLSDDRLRDETYRVERKPLPLTGCRIPALALSRCAIFDWGGVGQIPEGLGQDRGVLLPNMTRR